tara:strand:+ start:4912 stop:5166 length:255 start_codon:yes stop_codon:yes gene_type:complete
MKDEITGAEMKRFKLHCGCIRKDDSIISRDMGNPQYFDTQEEVAKSMRESVTFYASIGYKPWAVSLHERVGEGSEFERVDDFRY